VLEEAFKCDYMGKPFELRPEIHLPTVRGIDMSSLCQPPICKLNGRRAKL